jgi:hypothetical protein
MSNLPVAPSSIAAHDAVDEVVDVDHVARVSTTVQPARREPLVERRDRPGQVPWPVNVREPEDQMRHTADADVLLPGDLRDRVARDRRQRGLEVDEPRRDASPTLIALMVPATFVSVSRCHRFGSLYDAAQWTTTSGHSQFAIS